MGRKDKSVIVDDTQKLSLGARMRLARQRKQIALTDMSEKVKYSKNYLSNVENNKAHPSLSLVELYERVLELKEGELMALLPKNGLSIQENVVNAVEQTSTFQGKTSSKEDLGEMPDVSIFYGRNEQLRELKRWIVEEECRIVSILGIGGMGKTSLATRVVREVSTYFDFIFWRSLQNLPKLTTILEKCFFLFSGQREIVLPKSEDEQIELLLEYLRKSRCLLILDNFESVLQEGQRPGQYRPEYQGYGRFLQRLGASKHASCLLLTSREKPREIPPLEGKIFPVRSMQLVGLGRSDGRMLLERDDDTLFGSNATWESLVERYAGNPLALKLISTPIREFFRGDIEAFLSQGEAVFGDIQDLLEQQFLRLSEHEQNIMYWLAIEQEPVSIMTLQESIFPPIKMATLQEALESLRRRSMIEIASTTAGFYLLPVIGEYVLETFLDRAHADIEAETFMVFGRYAFMNAQSKEYLRKNQIRRVLEPLTTYLLTMYGQENSENRLKKMLTRLHASGNGASGYAAGNILNLLIQLKIDLSGYDFSHLAVRQAYLQGIELHRVNFSGSDLSHSVFTKTFGSPRSIALSPDGKLLAAGTANGEVRLWLIYEEKPFKTYQGHTDWVTTVAFSPDGTMLATGSDDQTIRVWEVATGETLEILTGHADWIRSLVFSPDGRFLASGGDDKMVYVWKLGTGGLTKTWYQHESRVYSVAYSGDGELLATGSEDRIVRIWNVRTRKCVRTLIGHQGRIYSVAFSLDKHWLFSGSDDQTIGVWQVATGKIYTILREHTGWVQSVAVSKDGELLASSSEDSTIKLWRVKTGQCIRTLQEHHSNVYSIAFSANGDNLISGSDDQTVRLWDVNTGQCVRILQGYSGRIYSIVFSSDGQWLASGGDDQQIRIWSVRTGECAKTLQGYSTWRYSLDFSPDSQWLAGGSDDQKIYIWDVKTGERLKILQGHNNWVRAVAFSPNGELLASGVDDQTVRIWQIDTEQCLHILKGHSNWIRSVAFSPDGELLASASNDRTVRLWSTKNSGCVNILKGHESIVYSIAFSPYDDLLASGSGDHTIRLWRVSTGECLQILREHSNSVLAVAFSPDGKLLISGSEDQTIRLWEVSTGKCLWQKRGHKDLLQSVTFSPFNDLFASSDYEGTIKFWNVYSEEPGKILFSPRPYENLNIAEAKGLTDIQKIMLKELGAVEGKD